jgi:hypothetical protein
MEIFNSLILNQWNDVSFDCMTFATEYFAGMAIEGRVKMNNRCIDRQQHAPSIVRHGEDREK